VEPSRQIISPMPVITKRRVEVIAFERERIVRQVLPTPCPICDRPSELLTVRQAGAVAQVGSASIYRWLAQGKVHGVKTAGGHHRICRNSLFLAPIPVAVSASLSEAQPF
jgi:hypothetical protein